MKTLYVIYDGECGLCCRAVRKLMTEPSYLNLRFAPASAAGVERRFGAAMGDGSQLVVVADSGEVYRGTSAWIMVLYALRRYRPLAMRLASPAWRPFAARAIAAISRNRRGLSDLLGWSPDAQVLAETKVAVRANMDESNACPGGACERPLNGGRGAERLEELIRARQRARARWDLSQRKDAPIAPPTVPGPRTPPALERYSSEGG
jgi:predicted DCC family thiol-disulfide oxidoreductase YuxK